ncbi:hypothetical protein IJ596_01115 [bacterium]|nr:hypothetical protein [bacterium]
MILLFGEKANKSIASRRNSNTKNHPVENSAILASNFGSKSLLSRNEYDMCEFSEHAPIDYTLYAEDGTVLPCVAFMSEFSDAVAILGEGGFTSCGDCSCGSFSGGSSSSFSSVC